jgi:hypothetical protein
MKPQPIHIGGLMSEIDILLIDLLEGMTAADWEKQTVAPQWKVKDVAVHLLDGNLRTLSMLRDVYYGETPKDISSYQDLIEYLNQLNADWVKATKRLSPKVIIELLKSSGKEYCDYLLTLNPDDTAIFSVAWAGENESKNWFHVAREYTEKWHHQQQIRLAIGAENKLLDHTYYMPYLNTSVRGLPHHYRNTIGEKGDLIRFRFTGNSNKDWFLKYSQEWELYVNVDDKPNCEVTIPDELAWKIFTKGVHKEEAIQQSSIKGKQKIGLKIFDMIAVMA